MYNKVVINTKIDKNLSDICKTNLNDHLMALRALESDVDKIILFASKIAYSLQKGGKIFWCGNGGSAADCQHLSAEFVCRFKNNRRPLSSISLTTDTSALTAIANDYDYESIFSRQIEANMKENDVLIAISTSGKSENIIKALKTSKDLNIYTIAMTGRDGGHLSKFTNNIINVDSNNTARIQEIHILIGHLLCEIIEKIII